MNSVLSRPEIARVLRALGIDPIQYSILVDLFSKLSNRQEFEGGSSRFSLRIAVGIFAAFSGFINLIVAFGPKPPVRTYIFGNFVFTTFLLVMILTMEAMNTFLNPIESSLLAHQPIRDGNYFAAKLTYLGVVVAYVVFPIGAVPALAGLNLPDASWLHPITYLISAYLLGFFVALIGCGILGLMFRIFHPSRVRNTVLWMQIGFFVMIGAGSRILRFFGAFGNNLNIRNSTALPLNWFVALASPDGGLLSTFFTWQAAVTIAGCSVFIVFGIRSLSKDYLTRVHSLLKSGPSTRRAHFSLFGKAARRLTGKPSGRGAFAFFYGMAKTDWQFRRTVYPMLIQFSILPLIGFARTGLGRSPFQPGLPTVTHILPHLGGLVGFLICFAITSSNQHRAAWIFLTFPSDAIRTFVRGLYWALWVPLITFTALLSPAYFWNWGIADAALFTIYSLAVASFYLSLELFMVDGLPFANPPEAMKGSMSSPLVIGAILGAGVLVFLQWLFIFQSRLVTAGATLVFAGAAYVISQTSMRYLEVNIAHNLHRIATGPTGMFNEVN